MSQVVCKTTSKRDTEWVTFFLSSLKLRKFILNYANILEYPQFFANTTLLTATSHN